MPGKLGDWWEAALVGGYHPRREPERRTGSTDLRGDLGGHGHFLAGIQSRADGCQHGPEQLHPEKRAVEGARRAQGAGSR
jgi:hypothetical protein